jgi:hypothetical protein
VVTPADYRPFTAAVALPPKPLFTVMLIGLVGQENLPMYFVLFLVNVLTSVSAEVTQAVKVAVVLLSVASAVSDPHR